MPQFIQCLESRTFLSATTTATLVADSQNVATTAATAKAELTSAGATLKADAKTISADLKAVTDKTNRQTNAALLKTLKADGTKALAGLRADATVLLHAGAGAAKRAAKDAAALLKNPTNATAAAKVAADVAALGTVSVAPLAKLQADLQAFGLTVELANITAANPSSAALAADAQTSETDIAAFVTLLTTDAGAFTATLAALSADVNATPVQSTLPNVMGSYSGSTRTTSGSDVGLVRFLSLDITSQSPSGVIAGTAVFTSQVAQISLNFTGMLTKDNSGNSYAVLTGTFTDPTTAGRGMTITTGNVFPGLTLQGSYVGTGGIDNADFTINMM